MPTNEQYWRKRLNETAQRRFDLTYEQMQKELQRVYKTASKTIELETKQLYYKLLDEELSRTDIWTYKHYRNLEKTINAQMVKIGLKEVEVLNYNLEEALREIYTETSLPKNIAFNTIDETMVKQIVARSWSEKHFISTVWDNKQKLANVLKKGITESIVLGKSKDKLVETVMQKMNVGFNNADMVVRTELMHTINEGQRQKYIDSGYKMGIILVAHDERLCNKCVEYANNEQPKLLNKIVLPTHPRCRCTMIPVLDEENIEKSVLNDPESDIIKVDEEIKQQINSGVYPKKLNNGAQNKHIKTHNNYIEGRSYLTISLEEAQELINKYAGTGEILKNRKKEWRKQEVIETDNVIGIDINNKTGEETATRTFKIHYSKHGTHIVPKKEE